MNSVPTNYTPDHCIYPHGPEIEIPTRKKSIVSQFCDDHPTASMIVAATGVASFALFFFVSLGAKLFLLGASMMICAMGGALFYINNEIKPIEWIQNQHNNFAQKIKNRIMNLGGIAGGGLGFVLFNVSDGVPGAVMRIKIDGGLGALDGFFYGAYDFKAQFLSSDKYKQWVREARKSNIYSIYQKVIQEDQRFKDYICMNSLDLISIPVRAPDGRIYEQQAIVRWIQAKEAEIAEAQNKKFSKKQIEEIRLTISFVRKCGFGVQDLNYYPEYFESLDKLVKIKISEMEDGEAKRVFEEAMNELSAAQQENKRSIFCAQSGKILAYVTAKNLDPTIAVEAYRRLKAGMNTQETSGLKKQEAAT